MRNLIFTVLILSISSVCVSQTTCQTPTIYGKLTYYNIQNTPLSNSVVFLKTLSGNIFDSCMTDPIGIFSFCSVPIGVYKISAKANIPFGGSNATDALIAIHHFVESIVLDSIRFTAGDLNANGYINATDALMILKRFIHLDTIFPIGDWVFEEPIISISDTSSQNINIHALCAGDLDGSYIPSQQPLFSCGDTLIDQRDNQKYPTVQIGAQCWLKKNMNIGVMLNSVYTPNIPYTLSSNNGIIEKYCLYNDTNNCNIYGGLYDWDELMQYSTSESAKGICPNGWHVPSYLECYILLTYLDSTTYVVSSDTLTTISPNAGGKLKETGTAHWMSPNTGATNESGFTALGAGNRTPFGSFGTIKKNSPFWTSSQISAAYASSLGLNFSLNRASQGNQWKIFAGQVRCIKDYE